MALSILWTFVLQGLPSSVQLLGSPDSDQCLAAINVMYAMLTELKEKSQAIGQVCCLAKVVYLIISHKYQLLIYPLSCCRSSVSTYQTWAAIREPKAGSGAREL